MDRMVERRILALSAADNFGDMPMLLALHCVSENRGQHPVVLLKEYQSREAAAKNSMIKPKNY